MKTLDKRLSARDVVAQLEDGMTIGIGGWGPRRKPMALVREIVRSPLRDLTVVAYGGPDVGLLCAAGKVRKVVFGFVSLDVIPLEPHFRRARETGAIDVWELDEGLLQLGLGTDLLRHAPQLRTVRSPYEDAETLLAMPAIELDVALLHVNAADVMGNTRIDGPDPFFDAWFARAAKRTYVSCETLEASLANTDLAAARRNPFERSLVTGVVQAPCGAHPTSCAPAYGWDLPHLKAYCAAAADAQQTAAYLRDVVGPDESAWLAGAGGPSHVAALPLPIL
jgi:glutaconate CoA-transferase subunit A